MLCDGVHQGGHALFASILIRLVAGEVTGPMPAMKVSVSNGQIFDEQRLIHEVQAIGSLLKIQSRGGVTRIPLAPFAGAATAARSERHQRKQNEDELPSHRSRPIAEQTLEAPRQSPRTACQISDSGPRGDRRS